MKQKCVRLLPGAPDTTTQLVQLPEPESLCVFDHQRVDRWHVDATFDDGGADQHVKLAIPEIHHGAFEHCFVHLAVGKRDARLGH